jgi:RNA exonuclease 1
MQSVGAKECLCVVTCNHVIRGNKPDLALMAASMKRSAAGSSSPPIPQVYKKIKQTDDEQHKDGAGDDQWTVVERRKSKSKTKRTFTRNDAKHPRFMYSNPDIIRRKHAVGIDDIRDLVLHLVADAAPPNWLRIEVRWVLSPNLIPFLITTQNPASIQKLIVLLIPGLTSSLLSLPPLPTSATANPNVPLSIPLPAPGEPGPALSFVSSTFSHACPTRAPGDKTRMHSVLGAFFQGPVSANEKAKRVQQRDACTAFPHSLLCFELIKPV